jgi:hypothetical protein
MALHASMNLETIFNNHRQKNNIETNLHSIIVVLFKSSGDRQNVGVENDIVRRKSDLLKKKKQFFKKKQGGER